MDAEKEDQCLLVDSEKEQCLEANDAATNEPVNEDDETNEGGAHEGRRVQLLRHAVSLSVKKVISTLSFPVFTKFFRPLYKKDPEALKTIQTQMLEQLESNISAEISQMYKEENIVEKMNGLDELVQNCSTDSNTQAWRPSGDPEKDSLAHVMPVKLKERDKLEKVLAELESQNQRLREAVMARQKRLLSTKQKIDKYHQTWKETAEVLESMPVAEMKEFIAEYSSGNLS